MLISWRNGLGELRLWVRWVLLLSSAICLAGSQLGVFCMTPSSQAAALASQGNEWLITMDFASGEPDSERTQTFGQNEAKARMGFGGACRR
jgi:hypothetical protein